MGSLDINVSLLKLSSQVILGCVTIMRMENGRVGWHIFSAHLCICVWENTPRYPRECTAHAYTYNHAHMSLRNPFRGNAEKGASLLIPILIFIICCLLNQIRKIPSVFLQAFSSVVAIFPTKVLIPSRYFLTIHLFQFHVFECFDFMYVLHHMHVHTCLVPGETRKEHQIP